MRSIKCGQVPLSVFVISTISSAYGGSYKPMNSPQSIKLWIRPFVDPSNRLVHCLSYVPAQLSTFGLCWNQTFRLIWLNLSIISSAHGSALHQLRHSLITGSGITTTPYWLVFLAQTTLWRDGIMASSSWWGTPTLTYGWTGKLLLYSRRSGACTTKDSML